MFRNKTSSFKGQPKGSVSRSSSSSSSEFDPRDGSNHSGQNVCDMEFRGMEEHHRIQTEEGAVVSQSPQGTLDLFLSCPHPNFHGIYNGKVSPHCPSVESHVSPFIENPSSKSDHGKNSNAVYDNEAPLPYPPAASHISPLTETPSSRSNHGKPSISSSLCNRIYDNEPHSSRVDYGKPNTAPSSSNIIYDSEAILPYPQASSSISLSMEKLPSRSDNGKSKPIISSSLCHRIPEDEAINQGFTSMVSRSQSLDSPRSLLGGSNRSTDVVFSELEDEDNQERSWGEVGEKDENIDDGAGDIGESFSAIHSVPGHRKWCSYDQQSDNDMFLQSKRNALRKHSLDERIPKYTNSCDEIYSIVGNRHEFEDHFFDQRGVGEFASSGCLPEFIGNGGGKGIFKVPVRAAVHPGRPPALELRPHPLRETQTGCFLRNIMCTDNQLWAGQESGVRFWNLSDIFRGSTEGSHPKGDEEAAPFQVSAAASPTLCLISDAANRLVWSGHKDGKIRSWKMDQTLDGSPFKECIAWQAHRAPVLSIVMTSYGKHIHTPSILFCR